MNLLTAAILEPILPGPQIAMALLGNFESPRPSWLWILAALIGIAWIANDRPTRLRSNPARGAWTVKTPYTVAMEEYLEAEERGISQTELKRLWRCVQKAKEYGRKYQADDPRRWRYTEEC